MAGIFWIIAGAIVISQEKTHAAVSSLPIQRAPALLLVAGILAILVGCVGCYCLRKPDFDAIKKPVIVVVKEAFWHIYNMVFGKHSYQCYNSYI